MISWSRLASPLYPIACLVCLATAEAQEAEKSNSNQSNQITVGDNDSEKNAKPLSKSEKLKIREGWVRRYQNAIKKLKTGNADEVEKIESMILNTLEPEALGPMLEVMGKDVAPIRLLLDRALANQDNDLAWVALAERLLVEPDPDVRRGLVKLIGSRQDKAGYERFLIHIKVAVTSKNPVRAGLGAMACADLKWRDRIPELIDQLAPVRFTKRVEWVPERVSAGGGGGLSVGSVEGYVSVPVPVVGPGVVAYGQNIYPIGNSLSMGGGVGQSKATQLTPIMRAGREMFPNPAVLAALVDLSGVDFGYDTQAWKKWQSESFRLDTVPPKRVPNP